MSFLIGQYDQNRNLEVSYCVNNIDERKRRIISSDQTMCIRYRQMIGFNYSNVLYNSCLDDTKRTKITRWRLSSHKLKIEKGRYTKPVTKEEDRMCRICNVRNTCDLLLQSSPFDKGKVQKYFELASRYNRLNEPSISNRRKASRNVLDRNRRKYGRYGNDIE